MYSPPIVTQALPTGRLPVDKIMGVSNLQKSNVFINIQVPFCKCTLNSLLSCFVNPNRPTGFLGKSMSFNLFFVEVSHSVPIFSSVHCLFHNNETGIHRSIKHLDATNQRHNKNVGNSSGCVCWHGWYLPGTP